MTLQLTPEQEAFIRDLAQQEGQSPAELLVQAAVWLRGFEDDEQEDRLIAERLAEADSDQAVWISSEEMDERVRKMLSRG